MGLIFDTLPERRIRANPGGWSTRWYPSTVAVRALIPMMIGPVFLMGGLYMTGAILSALLFLTVVFDLFYASRVEAHWDHEQLTLVHHGEKSWRWRDIDAVELTQKHLVVRSGESRNQVPLPPGKHGLDDILAVWTAHLEERPIGPGPTSDARWRVRGNAVRAGVRLRSGAHDDTRRARQRPAIAITAGVAFLSALLLLVAKFAIGAAPIFDVQLPFWSSALASIGLFLTAYATPVFTALLAIGRFVSDNRSGTIEMDAHKVTFDPVDKHPHTILWERIIDIGGDDCTLWVHTEDGRFEYDVTREPPGRINQLRADLIHRWNNVRNAVDDPVEAARRREQLQTLMGSAHHD